MRSVSSLFFIVAAIALNSAFAHDSGIVGSWQGTSLCVDKVNFPACKDERVIYDVAAKGSARDTVTLRADKIVNGVREFMGEFEFARSADSSWVARYENPRVKLRIVLTLKADHMSGVMMDEVATRKVREMELDRVH